MMTAPFDATLFIGHRVLVPKRTNDPQSPRIFHCVCTASSIFERDGAFLSNSLPWTFTLLGSNNMATHILLIEDNDHRRVTTLKHLLRGNYQVTPCSSIDEAEEVMRFIDHEDMAPDIVVTAPLVAEEGGHFRDALICRFAGIRWISFPAGRGLDWLSDRLDGALADDRSAGEGVPLYRGYGRCGAGRPVSWQSPVAAAMSRNVSLNVLLIEADDDLRATMVERLLERRDRVTSCRSIAEAADALAHTPSLLPAFDAIVSDVSLPDGNCLSLYLSAASRFPGIRWILISRPPASEKRRKLLVASPESAFDAMAGQPAPVASPIDAAKVELLSRDTPSFQS